MASLQETLDSFVQFVQKELFRRPFLNDDPDQESIMVRRGGGPRQLTGLNLNDNELIAKKDGQIIGVSVTELSDMVNGAEKKLVYTQNPAALEWVIEHEFNSVHVEIWVTDADGIRIYPDASQAVDANTVKITFTQAQAGTALLRWLD